MEIVILLLFATLAFAHVLDVYRRVRGIRFYEFHEANDTPNITVIVCAHDEAENLTHLLPLLTNLQYDTFEIILVLDRCTDKSDEIAESYASDRFSLITIAQCPVGIHPKKHAINQAIASAKGEWMLLTDADCRPKPDWVSEMAKGMSNDKGIVLGISPYEKRNGLLNLLIQYETFTTSLFFISAAISGKTYMGLGRNLAYRKAVFERVNGFGDSAKLTGGDDDLLVQQMANQENVGVILHGEAHVPSIAVENWSTYVHQKTRHFAASKAYDQQSIRSELIRWIVHIGFWGCFIAGLLTVWQPTLLIFVLAFLMKAISFNIVADRLEKRFNHLWLPVVDLLYVVILPLLSLRSLLVKRITWK